MKDKLLCDIAYGNGNWFDTFYLITTKYLSFDSFINNEKAGTFWNSVYKLIYNDNIDLLLTHKLIIHTLYVLSSHSFISIYHMNGYFGLGINEEATIFHWIFLYAFGIFIGFLLDLAFYYIGKFLSNKIFFKKLNYNFPKFFYIFFRFIPLIGAFSVLIGSTLTDKHDTKKDLSKILIGNTLFIFVSFLFGLTIFLTCGRFS
ncbi:hypothetical protein D8B46_01750 [Candidatus Gracilibacteria bacterium]|nr:MAG: hypothetical protein D8B46_01750 [Candidatus Gracilibacteria bacterium]